ncbi:hypothetical protein D3C72_1437560 [compost metagenome]
MRKSKVAVLDVQVTVNVEVQARATAFNFGAAGEAVKPLFYRKAEYLLPAHVVDAPMPTLTVRHLEKATIHLMQQKDDQALLAFRRAVASGVDPATILKVALACHTEDYREEAQAAFTRAVKYGQKDPQAQALTQAIATHLGYTV